MTVGLEAAALVYTDADGEHRFSLDRPTLAIGRTPGLDLVLKDPHISRRHAVVEREGAEYVVIDQQSSFGTYVNGKKVERATLRHGDLLQFGSLDGSRLRFQLPAALIAEKGKPASQATSLLTSLHGLQSGDDLTERPAAHELGQLNWLLSAARQLNAGGAIDEILTTLLELTLQLTGVERGFVFLKKGDEMRLARGLSSGGQILEEDSTVSRRAMKRAIESESKFSVSDTLADNAAAAWASVMVNRIRSIYCIPLRKRESGGTKSALMGLLYLDSQVAPGYLSEVDHQLLDTISTEAAALLHNALLAEAEFKARQAREELAIAAKIQSGLMSVALPVLPFAELQARSVPCLEIGGDFFTAVALEDCLCAGVADVSGKGVSAAIVAATLQGIIHAQLLAKQSLQEIAAQLNQFLYTRQVGKYATLVLFKLYPDGRVEYLNCGHIQPLVVRGENVERLEEANLVVGLLPGVAYSAAEYTMQPGDRLLVVTDGIVEAENPAGESFGDLGLDAVANIESIDTILDRVAAYHAPHPAQDDCTLLQVRYTG